MCMWQKKKKKNVDIEFASDHRVTKFSKERIEACVELFNDYCYTRDQARVWALKLEHFARA